jgi:hypothetical protein
LKIGFLAVEAWDKGKSHDSAVIFCVKISLIMAGNLAASHE